MGELVIERLEQMPVEDQEVELVERKGRGHPDSICDGIANSASVALGEAYQKTFGRILHHNLDKVMLLAGRSSPKLGGGTVEEPIRLIFGDRATAVQAGKHIDVGGIVVQAAKDWSRRNLRFLDPELHMVFQNGIKTGSSQLVSLFDRKYVGANDTSAASGYAPLTPTERTVLSVEKYMNSPRFKELFPETGEDIKVMGFRHRGKLHLTIAVAFVDRFVPDLKTYFKRKSEIVEDLAKFLDSKKGPFESVKIDINTLDDSEADEGMYLTVLGTSAEGSDSGQVGRGNRANGIIALNRPQSIEAHAGKNPVNHVGKIYSYLATHVARQIHSEVQGIREVYVYLCSQIGRPIDDPLVSSLKFVLAKGVSLEDVGRQAGCILSEQLAHIGAFTHLLGTKDFYQSWEESRI